MSSMATASQPHRATELGRPAPSWRIGRLAIIVMLIGVTTTAAISWTTHTLDRNNERRLLEVQTKQAAQLVASTIVLISNPLATALQIETATDGNTQQFSQYMAKYVGPGKLFVSASLWRVSGSATSDVVSTVGQPTKLVPTSPAAQALITRALHSSTFLVTGIPANLPQTIGYAMANPKQPSYAIYAERAIPANRQVEVERDSAFSDLKYATYLGPVNAADLTTTDLDPAQLPLTGQTAKATLPFGDTSVTLVTAPATHLGGSLGAQLPWIVLGIGALLTASAAFAAEQLARRRRTAEIDAHTITELYGDLGRLYGEQRTIAETLQNALLPRRNPSIANLEIASRYVAGADGVDVGGDWYSLVAIDDDMFAFVIGDVSGRGVHAATVMAQLRYTVRAYLLEGHPPAAVLEMCSHQIDVLEDAHFATVLVGLADSRTRELTLANAGHLNPLVVSSTGAQFVETAVGLPIGIDPTSYTSTTFTMPRHSTFLAFTDGLIERRGEDIGLGLERLAVAATVARPTLDGALTGLLAAMNAEGAGDDIAILAFRWIDPEPPAPSEAFGGGERVVGTPI